MTQHLKPTPPPLQVVRRGLIETWALSPLMILWAAAGVLFLIGVFLG